MQQEKTYLDMIGNQPAVPGHCNGELVISAGWLAGHEVQFKDAAEKEKIRRTQYNSWGCSHNLL